MTWQNDVDDDFLDQNPSDKYIDLSRKHSFKSKIYMNGKDYVLFVEAK